MKVLKGAEERRASLVKKQDGVCQPLGEAHVMSDHNAGKSELLLKPLNKIRRAAGQ